MCPVFYVPIAHWSIAVAVSERSMRSSRGMQSAWRVGGEAPHHAGLTQSASKPTMRVAFLSLEFTAGTFSGNGIYAKSQVCCQAACAAAHMLTVARGCTPVDSHLVRALDTAPHPQVRALCGLNATVLVVSARPAHLQDRAQQLAGTEELLEVGTYRSQPPSADCNSAGQHVRLLSRSM
jgi:hypothetical protein